MSFEFEPKENHTCPLFSQILNEFSQIIFCHGFTLLFPVTLHPHVRQHHQVLRLPRKVTLQDRQMLRLPRKMTLMIDVRRIWNVIYNARSNKSHRPTSPNTSPATQNDSHDWCPSLMKRHLQCAEQQVSTSNVTKYCTCHAKWLSWLMSVTFETLFTMRGATSLIRQRHQILHLPGKMTLMIDARHIWHVIYNARSNRHHPPTSPNTAPPTQNDSHDWCPSHMKRHLQCAEQQVSSSNVTKYCTCHAKWHAWLILVTYETSFTMRGTTGVTLQPHQILRLPRKIALQNLRKICRKQLKRQFQCAADSTMIRTWSEHVYRHLAPARSPRLLFALRRRILHWKLQHFALRLSTQISPNTVPATKSDIPTSPSAAPATKSDAPRSPNAAPATKSDTPRSPNGAPATKSDAPRSPNTAPATKSSTPRSPELGLDPWMHCYFTVTFTALLLYCCFHCTVTLLLHCYFTGTFTALLLYYCTVTLLLLLLLLITALLLYCYFYCTVTLLLHCYFTVTFMLLITALLLYCYFYCTVTLLLHCYFTVTFTVTLLLHCYFTVTFTVLVLYCYF